MGKQLRADIIVGGHADGSFYQLGSELTEFGLEVNKISEKLLRFGKESVEAYAGYEDYMLEATGALSTQYQSADELSRVMEALTEKGMEWASASRFTTEDVAAAISNAAHAGWNLEKILTGVPSAMNIALAGNMDMAQGLEYLVDITNAAGLRFDEMGNLVDYWAYAANRSSTTIPEMGAAMQKMGATLQFVKGDMAGLTTMLAVLANNGAKGTEAGTLLRNAMIRVIAPTKAAAEAMDMLGVSETELDEIYSNATGIENANKLLEEAGFSAYDSQGNLKSFMEIWQELAKATDSMTEQQRNDILTTIFPTRTITGALALMEAARKGWDGLYGDIQKYGPGYAEYLADIMESGLGGKIRHLESVYNALQTRAGESLSEDVGGWADTLSGLLEDINNLDSTAFDAVVAGGEALALAGPGLLAAGGALKLIGYALAHPIQTGVVELIAAIPMVNELIDKLYEKNFGDMSLEGTAIGQYLSSVNDGFVLAQANIKTYNDQVDEALKQYQDASSKLKSGIESAMVTGATLTPTQKQEFMAYGDQIYQAVMQGINGNYSGAMEYVAYLGGEDDVMSAMYSENNVVAGLMDLLTSGFQEATAQAQSLSQDLRDALTSAFTDNELTGEEISNIQSIMDKLNELAAAQANAQEKVSAQRILDTSQRLGIEGQNEIFDMADKELERILGAREDAYYDGLKSILASAEVLGLTEEETNQKVSEYRQLHQNDRAKAQAMIDQLKIKTVEMNMRDNFMAGGAGLQGIIDSMADGVITQGEVDAFKNADNLWAMMRYLDETVTELGGYTGINQKIQDYRDFGMEEQATSFEQLLSFYETATEFYQGSIMEYGSSAQDAADRIQGIAEADNAVMEALGKLGSGDVTGFKTYLNGENVNRAFQKAFGQVLQGLQEGYDFSAFGMQGQPELGAWKLMFDPSVNAEAYRRVYLPGSNGEAYGLEGENGITVSVDGDTEELQAKIAAEDGSQITVNVLADGSNIGEEIQKYDGMSIGVEINPSFGGVIGLITGKLFAEGGRATQASIFGEAGPEWAIPEEHSQRTAELLRSAAAASGFTWPELISRNGGLNAGGGGSYTIVYSPTIMAQDANGVERKLAEDKDRFEKWFRDKELRDRVEVYQ